MEGWITKPLGEVCELYQPQTISKKDLVEDGEYPVFGANGQIGFYDKFNHEDPELLITCRGATCGTVNVSLPRSWVTGNAMVVKPKSDCIHREFLAYGFRGVFNLSGVISGSAQPQITRTSLSPVLISFPPLAEQRRIVAILDEAFAAIETATAAAEKNLANARELFERSLDDLIAAKAGADNSEKLGSLVDRLTNGYVGPTRNIYLEMGVPYLLARHVRDNRLEFDGRTYVSDGFNLKNKKSMLKAGDVLLVQSGHIGHSAVVPPEHEGHNCHAMIVITPKKDVLVGAYLSLMFNTRRMRGVFASIRSGSTVPHLTCREVRLLDIPLPSAAAQEELVTASQQLAAPCEVLEAIFLRKLALLGELKQSLLQKAFRGEL